MSIGYQRRTIKIEITQGGGHRNILEYMIETME
jgi:hypothetical protein